MQDAMKVTFGHRLYWLLKLRTPVACGYRYYIFLILK